MLDKLRFKDENGQDYPEWKNKTLDKLCVTEQKSKYPASYGKNDGLYPFILSNTSNEMKYADTYILDSEWFIVNEFGEAYFRYINGKFAYSDHCIVLTTNENTKYIYYYLDANKKIINQKGFIGGGLKNIDRNYLKSFIIEIPSPEEQQKIADFLSTVDDKIENQKEIVANWEEIKKGLIQKIFSQEIRFKDENGQDYPEWETKRIEDIADIKSSSIKSNVVNGNYYNLTMGSVSEDGLLILDKKTNSNINLLKKNQLIMPTRDIGKGLIIGRVALIDKDNKYVAGNCLYTLNIKHDDSRFIFYQINSEKYRLDFLKKVTGSAQLMITEKDVRTQKIYMPCLQEQQKIADFLSTVDKKIEYEKNILNELIELKKGLLQRIFT